MKLLGRINNSSYSIFWILLFWVVLNIFSAYYTGIAHDEAYYWVFSQHLDWGYLDHPPAVAVLIWLGQLLLDNNLGVRSFNILLNAGSIYLLWKICKIYGKDIILFSFLYFGIAAFHVYSFIIVPDAPLLAASVLYFWFLKKYLAKDSIRNCLLLAMAIAFMIYSKYHGFLILIFTIVALPKLLFKRSFWLVALFSTIFFLPNILWQVNNEIPSLEYHISGRGNLPYRIKDTTNYFLGLLLITGPLLGFIFWFIIFKTRVINRWERVLKVTVFGFVIFFFIASFRSKIEPNWNSPLLIPLFILSYKYLIHHLQLRKIAIVLGAITLVLSLSFRFYASNDEVYNNLSPLIDIKNEFHFWEDWSQSIAAIADGKPVVFLSSYQLASKYTNYTRELSHSYNAVYYRKNQYDLWEIENKLQGQNVLVVSKYKRENFQTVITPIGGYYYTEIENFRSYNKIKIELQNKISTLNAGDTYPLVVRLKNQFLVPVTFTENPELPVNLVVSIFQHKKLILEQEFPLPKLSKPLESNQSIRQQLHLKTPEKPGSYYMYISLKPGNLDPGINSKKINFKVN
ncbi:ArnT family glycosyltransferase [Gillisia marina]|uniref:ArnT family glycosyltransferase n=1 Tax=Gillisia marina TaxID=1167637 RepID=UPI00029A3308|nr:glycosyltransferase family 39 protein [Gillisia marina]